MGDESGCELLEAVPDTTSADTPLAKLRVRFDAPARAQALVSDDLPRGVRWKRASLEELPRVGPIIHDDVLYMAIDRRVWALNPETGEAYWSFEVDGEIIPTTHTEATSVVDGERMSTARAALVRHGVLLVRSTGERPDGSHHVLYALDIDSGEPRWVERVYGSLHSPLLRNDEIFIPAGLDVDPSGARRLGPLQILVLAIEDGSRKRTYDLETPIAMSDNMLFGRKDTEDHDQSDLLAARAIDTGDLAWTRPFPKGATYIETLDVVEGHVYFSAKNSPTLDKLDASTGDEIWSHEFGDRKWLEYTAFDDERMYIVDLASESVLALSQESGDTEWSWTLPDKANVRATPEVVGDRVRIVHHGIGRDGAPIPTWIVELDKESGDVVTKHRISATVASAPLIWNDTVFYHDDDGGFVARELPDSE